MLRNSCRFLLAAAAGTAGGSTSPKPPKRILTSPYPSMLPQLEREKSVAEFMFRHWRATDADKVAVLQAETKDQLTYKQLLDTTERFAEIMYHEYGIRKGDVVCLLMLDNIYYPAIVYAVMRLGAIVTTSNAITTPEALCPQLEQVSAKLIVSFNMFKQTVEDTAAALHKTTGKPVRSMYVDDIAPRLKKGESAGAISPSYTALEESKPDDTVFIPFSSGTTGTPKGVQLTNKSLTANLLQEMAFLDFTDATLLTVLPFFHIYGFTTIMSCPLLVQATHVIMMKFSADLYLKSLGEYKVKAAFVAPPIINALIGKLENDKENKNGYDLSHLRHLICAAAPVAPEHIDRLSKLAPQVYISQGWGMTEMSPLVTGLPSPWHPKFDPSLSQYSVGTLAPDTELRVIKVGEHQQSGEDKSEGIDCEPGEDGELWARGPQMMKGYTNPAETAKCIVEDGWYRTGDIGRVDWEKGIVYITDRLKELIKYKGFQVSPVQVEAEVSKHPWVQDCVVVGISDPNDISYEVPRALVVLKESLTPEERAKASDAIYDFIKQHCPPHKRLHGGVRIVDSLMKNASGKVMRRQIRQAENDHVKEHGKF